VAVWRPTRRTDVQHLMQAYLHLPQEEKSHSLSKAWAEDQRVPRDQRARAKPIRSGRATTIHVLARRHDACLLACRMHMLVAARAA
jgi:hypothetical protein